VAGHLQSCSAQLLISTSSKLSVESAWLLSQMLSCMLVAFVNAWLPGMISGIILIVSFVLVDQCNRQLLNDPIDSTRLSIATYS